VRTDAPAAMLVALMRTVHAQFARALSSARENDEKSETKVWKRVQRMHAFCLVANLCDRHRDTLLRLSGDDCLA